MSGFGIWNVVFVLWLHYSHWENCLFQSCNDDELNVEATEFLIVSLANRFKGSSYPFQMSLYLFGYFFLCWCACLLHFSLNGLCFFGFFFFCCENPFDAIVFDFMSRIFQRFFSGVLIYFVSKNVVLKCKSKHETENILKTTTLTQQNKKRYKIRCQNKKEMSTGVSFFFLFLRMKTIFKQNIWRLFAFSINCASLVEIELEQK